MPAGVLVALCFLHAGTTGGVYWRGDAPSFLGVARNPFGSGRGFPGDPLAQGVAYRFGRVLLPLAGWVLALGRSSRVPAALAAVCVASFVVMIALVAEHLRRAGRSPVLAAWTLLLPFVSLCAFAAPTVIVEPMAVALVLFAYLADRDDHPARARVAAAAAILARETMVIAFLPLAWRAWRRDGVKGLRGWLWSCVPYVVWCGWVRVRIGYFPFTDPASNRRDALAPPFVGWWQALRRSLDPGQELGLLIALATIVFAIVVVRRAPGNPLAEAALVVSLSAICFGWSVWQYPSEAMRVLGPAHALLLVAMLTTSSTTRSDDDDCVLDLRDDSSYVSPSAA